MYQFGNFLDILKEKRISIRYDLGDSKKEIEKII